MKIELSKAQYRLLMEGLSWYTDDLVDCVKHAAFDEDEQSYSRELKQANSLFNHLTQYLPHA